MDRSPQRRGLVASGRRSLTRRAIHRLLAVTRCLTMPRRSYRQAQALGR